MRIRKYDFDYSRRKMMANVAAGVGGGVLAPVWPTIAATGQTTKAYPDEVTSIEVNTKGKIKVGDEITAKNVEHVKHLLDPIFYEQVSKHGRKFKIRAPTKNIEEMFPYSYLEATLKNYGKAKFDDTGNVVEAATGGPWIGGNPFPDIKTGDEGIANLTLSWGRHDLSQYAVRDFDINPDGSPAYTYDFYWTELNTTARTGKEKYFKNQTDRLRHQSVFFTSPQEQAGASFLVPWYYDQRKFPDIYGYLPQFRRVRQFPANQRFEPLVPGAVWFLSDPWAAGDPFLTWGNHKIEARKPMLGPWASEFERHDENWEPPRQKDNPKFFDIAYEMAPDVIVTSCEPTGYPRSPVSKRVAYVDARNMTASSNIRYDRQGKLWSNFEMAHGQFKGGGKDGKRFIKAADGSAGWSWTYVHIYDFQNRRMSLCNHSKGAAGVIARFDADPEWLFNTYCTPQALQTLGRA